jgi:hypothetical protein
MWRISSCVNSCPSRFFSINEVNDGLMNRRVGMGRFLMEVTRMCQKDAPCGAKVEETMSFAYFVEPKIQL